jgi:multidrug efflux pump subunit AcrA (membrane-fusion protein)
MYEADDITEETEEIIIKRAQHSVDRAIHYLNRTKNTTEATLDFTLPREEEDITLNLARVKLSTKKETSTHEEKLAKLAVGMRKQERSLKESEKNLAKLKRDAKLLSVRSPIDGVLYHGAFVEGTWMGRKGVQSKLREGGKLLSGEVVMTVVSMKGLAAHALLSEADYRKVAPKMKGWATPTADPGHRVAIEVKSVSRLPSAPGQYKILFTVNPGDKGYLHPGMSCAIRLPVLNKPKAITVPSKALRANGKGELVVRLKTKKSETERVVKTGNSHGGKTEILKGLSEGDEILLP